MAGAKKKTYQTFHTSGRGQTGHLSETPGDIGPEELNQAAPGLHMVDRVPSTAGNYDENFAHKTNESEKD
jgi:hypothetical protein